MSMQTEAKASPANIIGKIIVVTIVALLLSLAFVTSTGCSDKVQEPLVGEWKLEALTMTPGDYDSIQYADTNNSLRASVNDDLTMTLGFNSIGLGEDITYSLERITSADKAPSGVIFDDHPTFWIINTNGGRFGLLHYFGTDYGSENALETLEFPRIVILSNLGEMHFIRAD